MFEDFWHVDWRKGVTRREESERRRLLAEETFFLTDGHMSLLLSKMNGGEWQDVSAERKRCMNLCR
jgi:hypothetical protein